MVLLLTCDCALLMADVLSHILKHFHCALEDTHTSTIQGLEARQLELHGAIHQNNNNEDDDSDSNSRQHHPQHQQQGEDADHDQMIEETQQQQRPASVMTRIEIQQESRRLDRRMEGMELAHARRVSILDSAMFSLELICHLLTIAHFCHIWSLHGVQFTLIDGVLALHLHSAVSSACKKIAQRRNVHSIARDLQGHFPNATDEELRKASAAGDVCCICLGTMSTGGHVKKVKCGHLYHTHCLREVVERAQNLQAAKCPLCRASLMDGGNSGSSSNSSTIQRDATVVPPPGVPAEAGARAPAANDGGVGAGQRAPQGGGDERALFRFSTEGILPVWLPVPAFSFEVVRRPPVGAQAPPQAQQPPVPAQPDNTGREGAQALDADNQAIRPLAPVQQQEDQAGETSFLRRLLQVAGAIPMSPEEEARALAQLVDMFPQYDRSDLLRELRDRGSAEAVAEAILMGIFSGVPRGD